MRWYEVFGESEQLVELFDTGVAHWSWTEESQWSKQAEFEVNGIGYVVIFEAVDDYADHRYEAAFYPKDRFEHNDSIANLGTQGSKSIQVFSTVLDIMKTVILKDKPDAMTFTGQNENGKAGLYGAMLKRFANQMKKEGYTSETRTTGEWSYFTIKRDDLQEEQLNELFDNIASYSWSHQDEHGWHGHFNIDGTKFSFDAWEQRPGEWEFEFSDVRAHERWGNTGAQGHKSLEVFGTVLAMARDLITEVKPTVLSFSAKRSNNRVDIYSKMVKRSEADLKKLGYDLTTSDTDNHRVFTLTLNKSSTDPV